MEHDAEFDALLRPSASDYDDLLRYGHVIVRDVDVPEWRATIRAKARADKISVRTGGDSTVAWAIAPGIMANLSAAGDDPDIGGAIQLAFDCRKSGHDARAICSERGQQAWVCRKCRAVGYTDWRPKPPIIDGPWLFDAPCTAS